MLMSDIALNYFTISYINPNSSTALSVEVCSVIFSGISYTNVGYPDSAIGFETSFADVASTGFETSLGKYLKSHL